jgi:hypothetical protein
MAGDQVETFTPSENENWRAIRLLDTHVLEYLQSRSIITGDQYCAGVEFYSDWYKAGLAASGVIDPGRVIVDGGSSDTMTEIKLDALHRWQRAVQALGLIHSQVLTDILLTEEPLVQWGRRRAGQNSPKLAKLAALTALRLSLEALDLHYHGRRRTPARSSHAEDYRPSIHDVSDAT